MGPNRRPSVYDQLRPHLSADDLIKRLGLVEARRIGSEAYCRPLCHESSSGESLQINLHSGRWNCKACQHSGVRGDLIQLVEYVLSGGRAPSHGTGQGANAQHRAAMLWLCEQYGVAFDQDRMTSDPSLDVVHLFAMAAHEHLLATPAVLTWVQEKWGFDLATVEAYGIGFMPSPLLPQLVNESQHPNSREAFKSSGLGWHSQDGQWHTRFEGRVTFPYLEGGRAVYLIGRSTPWTPATDGPGRVAKYHKLAVHSSERPYISERVTNDHLFGEAVLDSTDVAIVTEGVADAVALSSLGVPVVSPVTISFNATDLERFVRKVLERNIVRVEILFDNELSGSGNWAALRVGRQLVERGIVTKVLSLPLGPEQKAARDEVLAAMGAELFEELERSEPLQRKTLIAQAFPDEGRRTWILEHINASKIDAAEWVSQMGAAAAGRFNAIRKAGRDVIDLAVEEILRLSPVDAGDDPSVRLSLFAEVVELAAHVEDSLARGVYAGAIATAAGEGVTKAEVARRIAVARKAKVKPKRETEKASEKAKTAASDPIDLVLLPPEASHVQPAAPPPPVPSIHVQPGAPAAPPAPGRAAPASDHQRYATARDAVARAVDAKMPAERLGEYVAQTITVSMGFTPFRTPDELYLVRGSERIATGLDHSSARFESLLFLASGLTPKKSSHRAYIAAVVYFLENASRRAEDVSWSYVGPEGAVFFPTGDDAGRILKIEAGKLTRTKMAEVRVPAVAGADFAPVTYVDDVGGIAAAVDAFRWTSISASDRLVLIYWIVCLPILRRIGTVPIVRVQGSSSSGKTRTIEAVSYLVNGKKGSSVPTAAALVSRMSTEMLTVDDNRETGDVSPAFMGTLLQATHLGAREKRKANSDTGTVVERVCGALLMNGVEPIHDGRSELASRILTLRSDKGFRVSDSPTSERVLRDAIVRIRDPFWSEAVRRCAFALAADELHGEALSSQIEDIFGHTKIGRLSAYLRVMYLAWCGGLPEKARAYAVTQLAQEWRTAFSCLGEDTLNSLLQEELAVSCLRYAFAWGAASLEGAADAFGQRVGLDGFYVEGRGADGRHEAYLGPIRATRLAQVVREAGKELNAPPQIAQRLRAGQLEQRLLDGLGYLEAAGFEVQVETTHAGRRRFTFRRVGGERDGTDTWSAAPGAVGGLVPPGGDTWTAP